MVRIAGALLLLLLLLGGMLYVDDADVDADIVIVNASDAFTLDPQRMSYLHDFRLGYALYEGLVVWNNDDYSFQPGVAESWIVSDDGRTYRFHLRDDARWSNSEPVTAHDFAFSLRRLLLPDSVADYSSLLFVIDGAESFYAWRARQTADYAAAGPGTPEQAAELWREAQHRFDETVGVRAIDNHTLEIRLTRPTPYLLDLLCFAVCCPVHRPTVEGWPTNDNALEQRLAHGWHTVDPPSFDACRWVRLNPSTGRLEQRHEWARPGRLVGNGPYTLTRWRYRRDMLLEPNPHYHTPQKLRNSSIQMLTIEDANTRVLAYASGLGHWVTDVGVDYTPDMLEQRRRYLQQHADQLAALTANGMDEIDAMALLPPPTDQQRRDIHPIPAFATDFYSFNCRPTLADGRANPFADARVRRAFVYATNRHNVVTNVTRLGEPVMTSLVPPGSIAGYDPPVGLAFNLDRAQQELADAGWSDRDGDGLVENADGQPFPTVEILWTPSLPRYRWISLELKDQWQRHLGVQVELRAVDTKFYREDLRSGNFMIARGRWYGDYGDPTTFLELNRCHDGNNDRGFCDPRVDQLLDEAADETDAHRRFELLAECERIVVREQVPMLVLCQLVTMYLYDPTELTGLSRHPRLTQQLWKLHRRNHPPDTAHVDQTQARVP